MSRICKFTGRKTSSGHTYTHRGRAKYLGGVGTKVTGKTKRRFRPNIQSVMAIVDGSVGRIKASTKAIRMGLVVKPLKRRYGYGRAKDLAEPATTAAAQAQTASDATARDQGAQAPSPQTDDPAAGQEPTAGAT